VTPPFSGISSSFVRFTEQPLPEMVVQAHIHEGGRTGGGRVWGVGGKGPWQEKYEVELTDKSNHWNRGRVGEAKTTRILSTTAKLKMWKTKNRMITFLFVWSESNLFDKICLNCGELATSLLTVKSVGVYSTTLVQYLYISCYLSDNKPVLSYLLSRLLPQNVNSSTYVVIIFRQGTE
jgi:hypothetical protein